MQDLEAAPPTEGILKAQGPSWYQLVGKLMQLIMPWKGRLVATFLFGVSRVLAFIGVGVVSALIVLALKNGDSYGWLLLALVVVAPLAGILHWLESWIAHDMAFRLLAEMRVAVFRKLDELAPAYLVRRRSGDLTALATHDIELVEYFFAHTVARLRGRARAAARLGVLGPQVPGSPLRCSLPARCRIPVPSCCARRWIAWARGHEAAGELSALPSTPFGAWGDRHLPAGEARGSWIAVQAYIRLRLPFFGELTLQQSSLEVFTGLGGLAVVVTGAALAARDRSMRALRCWPSLPWRPSCRSRNRAGRTPAGGYAWGDAPDLRAHGRTGTGGRWAWRRAGCRAGNWRWSR